MVVREFNDVLKLFDYNPGHRFIVWFVFAFFFFLVGVGEDNHRCLDQLSHT